MAFHKAYSGCRPEAQYTYYDGCFLRAFATVPTWQALHRVVARCVATTERHSVRRRRIRRRSLAAGWQRCRCRHPEGPRGSPALTTRRWVLYL